MDTRVLMETPHRSVHWALVNKLRAQTATSTSEQCLAEWKKLVNWEIAAKVPHVFTEAVAHVTRLAIAGRLDVAQITHMLAALVAAPQAGKRSNAEPTIISAVIKVLVQLLAAGASKLVFPQGDGIRDNILHTALERNPSLWTYVIQHIRDLVVLQRAADDSDKTSQSSGSTDEHGDSWGNICQFLRYALLDPTVPVWAQGKVIDMVFSVIHQLAFADGSAGFEQALEMLEWAVDVARNMALPAAHSGIKPETMYCVVDVQGRCDQHQMVISCVRAVETLCAQLTLADARLKDRRAGAGLLRTVVDRLRLMAASLSFTDLHSSQQLRQVRSSRIANDKVALAATHIQLLNAAVTLRAVGADKGLENAGDTALNIVLWAMVAYRINNAFDEAEQAHLLCFVEKTCAEKSLVSSIPAQMVALMRFPLLCVATDGFTSDIRLRALRLCEAFGEGLESPPLGTVDEIDCMKARLCAVAECKWVSGALPVLISNACNYLSVYVTLCRAEGVADRASPLNSVVQSVDLVNDQPLLLAPLLVEWGHQDDSSDSRSTLPRLALAAFIQQIQHQPSLRIALLPLFMHVLRHANAPMDVLQILLLDGIPALASTSDAYATSRVVAVISGIWKQSLKGAAPDSSVYTAEQRAQHLRLCCLAVRGWARVVIHNSRVWRDFKPIIAQFVETKKGSKQGLRVRAEQSVVLKREYEWTILVTIRDLVARAPDRYADQMLPFVYSLLNYAKEQLCSSSTALLIETACICVESRVVDVRSVWATIVAASAEYWIALSADGDGRADAVLGSLARFSLLVATHGESTDTYAAFRQDILSRYVAPFSGYARDSDNTKPRSSENLQPQLRNQFLAALAAFPADEVLALISGGTPSQTVHSWLSQVAREQTPVAAARHATHRGSLADMLAALMDNEVRFMRRSLLKGSSTFARVADDDEMGADDEAPDGPGQQRSWAQSNLVRSQWIHDVLSPPLSKARARYWDGGNPTMGLASGFSLAAMISSHAGDPTEQTVADSGEDSNDELGDGVERTSRLNAGQGTELFVPRLKSLLTDASLSDHWCLRSSAVDAWQVWFSKELRKQQLDAAELGEDNTSAGSAFAASEAEMAISEIQEMLTSSYIPAHMENALYALAGLLRTTETIDQALASELSTRASIMLAELQILPCTMPPDELWPKAAASLNDGVLAAAIECVGQAAATNSHDSAALSRTAQVLMAGLTLTADGSKRLLPSLAVQAIGRALTRLYVLLASKAAASATYSDDLVTVEADDIRRCIERLSVLHVDDKSDSLTNGAVDIGDVGLATALAVMHRHWIARIINSAMVEQNNSPQASQALRTVAHTLALAFETLHRAESGQWSAQTIPSLYYLCFVWPPRPILQRHVELHKNLFTVTPDRVWQAATRLVHKLWSPSTDGISKATGVHHLDIVNFAEIAVATLTYHLVMTSHRNTAHAVHARLVQQYTDWVRGEIGDVELAANEKPSLRANRTVALGVLLGIPLHGVPETTVSNGYLPATQRKCLPVLLGLGSIKYGSTGWLRASESVLHKSLGSLLGCSGLAALLDREVTEGTSDGLDDSDEHPSEDSAARGIATADDPEISDVRTARIASFVLGAFLSQSAQAMRLLAQDEQSSSAPGAPVGASDAGIAGKNASLETDAAIGTGMGVAEDAAAASEEPKSLGHLPAPTSWCRAVWETISELSESLVGSDDRSLAQSVETRLVYLLSAMLKASRPFPVIDTRKVFKRLLDACLENVRAANVQALRQPLLLLTIEVASKLGATTYSMAQFLDDATLQILNKVVELLQQVPSSSWYIDEMTTDTLPAIALACVGSVGFGRILQLAGLVGDEGTEALKESSAKDATRGWTKHKLLSSLFTQADVVQIVSTTAFCAKSRLAAALERAAPLSLCQQDSALTKSVLESDAERMFHMMSKVAISAPKAANLCSNLISILFSGRKILLAPADGHPVILALQAQVLATLQASIANADAVSSREVSKLAAREKMSAEVTELLQSTMNNSFILTSRERRLLMWGAVGAACCGLNAAKGDELLAMELLDVSDTGFCAIVCQQALLLQQQIAHAACAKRTTLPTDQRPQSLASLVSGQGPVASWLKRTFKEWARRLSAHHSPSLSAGSVSSAVMASLQDVASALFAARKANDSEVREYVVQALDLVILAASILGSGSQHRMDLVLHAGIVCWLLPLLTGYKSAAEMLSPLVNVTAGELLEYVETSSADKDRGSAASGGPVLGQQHMRQYSVQLRTRTIGLLDIAKAPVSRRSLRFVLADLAMLGRLPSGDLWRTM
ncbi:hypothetical protein H4R20_002730 [Coemansia guatemalensis]|uniref:Uncharacterized protein n=1 Tax=Coemansia guatemalensis TaxID=2761395 RepID=A0A9W8I1Y2_9FUNG|nr:hypothetical protein H4R20_002730 [Coemansia guatemalensis]